MNTKLVALACVFVVALAGTAIAQTGYFSDGFDDTSNINASTSFEYNQTGSTMENNFSLSSVVVGVSTGAGSTGCGNVVEFSNGTLMASYEVNAGAGGVKIKISYDGGNTWPDEQTINSAGSCPRLTVDDSDTVHAIYNSGSTVIHKNSTDFGATWSSAVTVSTGGGESNIMWVDGNHLIACYEDGAVRFRNSTDGGGTWNSEITVVDTANNDEDCAMLVMPNGTILLTWEQEVVDGGQAWSQMRSSGDNGTTWSDTVTIWDGSAGSYDYDGGNMVTGPSDGELWYVVRTNERYNGTTARDCRIKKSYDNGSTWSDEIEAYWQTYDDTLICNRPAIMKRSNGDYILNYDLGGVNIKGSYRNMTITSSDITPSGNVAYEWFNVSSSYNATLHGNGSTLVITYSLLDMNGTVIPGFSNMTDGENLSSINNTAYPTIYLQAYVDVSQDPFYPFNLEWWNLTWLAVEGDNGTTNGTSEYPGAEVVYPCLNSTNVVNVTFANPGSKILCTKLPKNATYALFDNASVVMVGSEEPISEYPSDLFTLGLFHLNESSEDSVNDSSANGIIGTAYDATIVTGRFSNARNFTNTAANGSFVEFPNPTTSPLSMKNRENGTIEAMVYLTDKQTSGVKLVYADRASDSSLLADLFFIGGNSTPRFKIRSNSPMIEVEAIGTDEIPLNTWTHLAGTFEADAGVRLYVNGVLNASNSTTFDRIFNGNSAEIRIGARSDLPSIVGIIDEVRISSVTRNFTSPINITLDTGNDGAIDHNSNVTLGSTTVDLNETAIRNYLSSCTADSGGYCEVPINVSLNAETNLTGWLSFSDLNISYSFDSVLVECGGAVSNVSALNFSFYDEENRNLGVFSDIEAEFDLSFSGGFANVSFNVTNQTYLNLCIYPSWSEYVVDSTLKYTNNPTEAKNYSIRYYFLQNATIDNVTDDIFLYLLEDSLSSQITFVIKNVFSIPQSDVIVKATRFFVANDTYTQVATALSDFEGKATTQLKLNEWYIFIVEQNGQVLRTLSQKFLINTNDIDIFTDTETLVEYFKYYDSLGASCTANNATQALTCVFSDTSGKMVELNLTIEQRRLVGGFQTICTNTTTASAGTLSCSYAGYNNTELTYTLEGRFCCSQQTFFPLFVGSIPIGISPMFGTVGVVILMFIMVASILFGYWHPAIPVVMGTFAIVVGVVTQIIVVSSVGLASIIIAAGFVVYKMR